MLLDPSFARELEALRRKLSVRARSGGGGDHLARRRGGSAEFMEHRPYAPGDDLRRIDWLAFARTGEPVFKLFRTEEDVVVRVVIDASASLAHGTPTKLETGKKVAAAIAYMALASSERAQVIAATDGVDRMAEPTRGRAALTKILRELDAIKAARGTDLSKAIDAILLRARRPGMLVIVSDFLDSGPFDAAISRAASAGHDLGLVQVLADDEISPNYDGDFALEDAETGETVDVTVDDAALRAYNLRLNGLFSALRSIAKRARAPYVRTTNKEPTIEAVRRFVARAVD
ncbi:MAG: DUF58 domain-containing protein [Polyangiaceae bacterium]